MDKIKQILVEELQELEAQQADPLMKGLMEEWGRGAIYALTWALAEVNDLIKDQ